jgi:hypothetical protein
LRNVTLDVEPGTFLVLLGPDHDRRRMRRGRDLPRLGRLTGVFAETRAARGEVVGLRLEPGGCHVFAEPADGAEPPAGRPDTAGITSLNRQ